MALKWSRVDGSTTGAYDNRIILNLPTATAMDSTLLASEDMLGDVDEPPDESQQTPRPTTSALRMDSDFEKTFHLAQKTSLLTQALHSDEDKDEEESDDHTQVLTGASGIKRGPSTASTWSHNSGASTAELTSDGGLTSPGTRTSSPSPPPPAMLGRLPPLPDKRFDGEVQIRRADGEKVNTAPKPNESSVEAGLGRKRCVTFACGRKDGSDAKPTEAPKRPCMLKFVCPSKVSEEKKEPEPLNSRRGRLQSPPPPPKRQVTPPGQIRLHRDSDSTVRNESPRSFRRPAPPLRPRQPSFNSISDLGRREATRFHEFACAEEEIDEWVEQSTVHRNRLTVNDTLSVENGLRRLGQEIEDEALEEEEELEDEENEEDDEDMDDDEDEDDLEETDDGFQTDDEEGFAVSDDESDAGSDYAWWAPSAGAAHDLEHIRSNGERTVSESSIGSLHSPIGSLETQPVHRSKPVKIRSATPDLPDSTDFVCGTLDEDQPLEEAYIKSLEQRRAAKHKVCPQDIDPTFPQSDPEIDDEEDDDDVSSSKAEESDQHFFMHGRPDWQDEGSLRGRPAFHDPFKRSPHPSPKRLLPPPPKSRRSTLANRSPPPAPHRKTSPAPVRRLFGGESPRRVRSPPVARLRSPPPTRRTSYARSPPPKTRAHPVLAARPSNITHTSSLPRPPSGFPLRFANSSDDDDDDAVDTPRADNCGCASEKQHRGKLRARGAIDIVKGLERKRALRKEKIFAKQCRKQQRPEKKPLMPGRGAERMQKIGIGRYNAKRGVPEPIWGGGKEEFVLSL